MLSHCGSFYVKFVMILLAILLQTIMIPKIISTPQDYNQKVKIIQFIKSQNCNCDNNQVKTTCKLKCNLQEMCKHDIGELKNYLHLITYFANTLCHSYLDKI